MTVFARASHTNYLRTEQIHMASRSSANTVINGGRSAISVGDKIGVGSKSGLDDVAGMGKV